MTGRSTSVIMIILLTLTGSLLGTRPGAAHEIVLAGSTPTDQSVVRSVGSIELRFTDRLQPEYLTFTLRSADGVDHGLAAPELSDGDTVARLAPSNPLPDGRYRVGFQIVLSDGDAGAGVVEFEVSADGRPVAAPWPAADQAAPEPPRPRAEVGGVLPWVVGGTVVVLVGFVAFAVRARRRDDHQPTPGGSDA